MVRTAPAEREPARATHPARGAHDYVSSVRSPLVVVSAHPDDETIGAAALLLRTARAAVVHATDGAPRDPRLRPSGPGDRAAYARLRRAEALAALAEAGLAEDDVLTLGAVDQEADRAIASLARELAAVLRALRPRVVVTHSVEGGHPDHDAVAVAVRAARALLRRSGAAEPRLFEMTSYHRRDGRLVTGAFLPGPAPVLERPLTPAQREVKRRMLDRYASQRETLSPFGVEVERFRAAGPLDLEARPHPGPLQYESLGWARFEDVRERARGALGALGLRGAP